MPSLHADTFWVPKTTRGSKVQHLHDDVGNERNTINGEVLSARLVPDPESCEQRQVTVTLDARVTRIQSEEAYRDKLKQLKKGLMDDLLMGRVRVSGVTSLAP